MKGINKLLLFCCQLIEQRLKTENCNLVAENLLKTVLTISLLITAMGCTNKLSPEKYLKYFEKNKMNYCVTTERNGVTATIMYQPVEYLVAREKINGDTSTIQELMNKYGNSLYFLLILTSDSNKTGSLLLERDGYSRFSNNVYKNTFQKDNDIFLLNKKDTVKLTDYQYERNWGIGNNDSFLFIFHQKDIKGKIANYTLRIREIITELGTIEIPLKKLIKKTKKVKG